MLKLYHCHNSYASQKVRLYLEEMNIPWESQHIDLLTQEHLTDEYIKINPRGLVPTLDDNGNIILNSTDIMQHLNDHYVNDSTFDTTLSQEIYEFCKQDESLHDPHIRTLSYHHLWMTGEQNPEEVERVLLISQRHPDKARGEFLARAIQRQITEDELARANKQIVTALDDMEKRLQSQSSFLFGDSYTMADAVGTVRLARLKKLKLDELLQRYPMTLAYYDKMALRSNFKALIFAL